MIIIGIMNVYFVTENMLLFYWIGMLKKFCNILTSVSDVHDNYIVIFLKKNEIN